MNGVKKIGAKRHQWTIWTIGLILSSSLMMSCKSDTPMENKIIEKQEEQKEQAQPIRTSDPDPIKEIVKPVTVEPSKKKAVVKKAAVKKPAKEKVVKQTVTKKEKPVVIPEPIEEPQAKITFVRMNHSFGEIKSGDKFDHKFYFTNSGTSELIIHKVTATCGCTQPSFPFIPIAPGEEGFIGVMYNSVGKEGAQRPKLTVYTNAEPANYSLYLEGEVLPKEEADEVKEEDSEKE